MNEKKKAVIFDLDGTLWDSTIQVMESWNSVFINYNTQITHEQMCSYMGKTQAEIGRLIFPELPMDQVIRIMTEATEMEHPYVRQHGGRIYSGVEDMLKALSEKNMFLAIVSNCQDGYVQAFLEYSGLGRYFHDFEMAGRTGKSKGENILLVIERNGLESAVYLGDTEGDQKAAGQADIPFIYAEWGFGNCFNPDYSASSAGEIPALIEKIL